ncbi:MAG TPA: response regulator [Gemmatimonadales bacterium]|nr:response regulator [Gemmatimonadales bacterium]
MSAPAAAARPVPRVLIVEDDPAQAKLVELLVANAGLAVAGVAATAEAAVRLAGEVDVVLMDFRLAGDRTGLDALRDIRAAGLLASVIVMTGHGSERVAAEALHLGASDYIIKDESFTTLLPEVVARVVRVREIERQLAAAQQDLIRAERRAAIGEIVVALSHEINNPLMALTANLDLLRLDERALPPAGRDALKVAREQLTRITDILKRVGELDRERATTYVAGTRMTDLKA